MKETVLDAAGKPPSSEGALPLSIPATGDLIPTRRQALTSRVRRDAESVAIPVATLVAGVCIALHNAHSLTALGIAGFCSGIMLAFFAVLYGYIDVPDQIHDPSSMIRSLLSRIPAGRTTRDAATAVANGWHDAKIEMITDGYGYTARDNRGMTIDLANGGRVHLMQPWYGPPQAFLGTTEERSYGMPDKESSIGMAASSRITSALGVVQRRRLAILLGAPEDASAVFLSLALGRILALKPSSDREFRGGHDASFYVQYRDYVKEEREIRSIGLKAVSVRSKSGNPVDLMVEAPGVGLLMLPAEPFYRMIKKRSARRLALVFGGVMEPLRVPVFLGNARATRIAELATRALRDDPDLRDGSGASVRTLVEDHMPRLLARHRSSAATASSQAIPSIDAELDRGLDVVARALGGAIDAMNDRKMDALRTEVRFLESRHPEGSATPTLTLVR